jgi:hypothetical protein
MKMHVVLAFISALVLMVLVILQMNSPAKASSGRDIATIIIIAAMLTLGYAF